MVTAYDLVQCNPQFNHSHTSFMIYTVYMRVLFTYMYITVPLLSYFAFESFFNINFFSKEMVFTVNEKLVTLPKLRLNYKHTWNNILVRQLA